LFAECFSESLLTGDYIAPRRSRAAPPLDHQVSILIEAAERDFVQVFVIDYNLRDLLADSRRAFTPQRPLPALLSRDQKADH
jgi:hypothetical protein